jgi:phospholipase/carboxylesterase
VEVGPSRISVPGARGFTLSEGSHDEHAYLVAEVGEFAHLHPVYDGSLHLVLPSDLAADVSTKGWGRPSPGFMMVHGPRDEAELATVLGIVTASHAHATNASTAAVRAQAGR